MNPDGLTQLSAELSHLRQEMGVISSRLFKLELVVYNRLGAVIPDQVIQVSNQATKPGLIIKTDEQKRPDQQQDDVPAGMYSLEAAAEGAPQVHVQPELVASTPVTTRRRKKVVKVTE
jgi:hypothetical protein